MAKIFRRKYTASDVKLDIDNRPIIDDADLINETAQQMADIAMNAKPDNNNLRTNNLITNRIDPRLTNETLILAKLRADMSRLPDDDSNAIAAAYASTAQGAGTRALKIASTAQGASTIAAGVASNVQGINTIAAGTASNAQGYETTASSLASTAQGIATNALEIAALAEGVNSTASGLAAHAEGSGTTASGAASHAEGSGTTANGAVSHAEGSGTTASGSVSHAEGSGTTASGDNAHAEGLFTSAIGGASHAEGRETTTIGFYAHAEGTRTAGDGGSSHAEGEDTRSTGLYSHAEGKSTRSPGSGSHAEGNTTNANGEYSHSQGENTTARGYASHAEGQNSISNGDYSHAEGQNTVAQGISSHVEGNLSLASGNFSHAEGFTTRASGISSHSEGNVTIASGLYSHAEGSSTDTANQEGAHIMGRYGDAAYPYSWHLANGTDADNKGLAAVIRNDGQGIADQGWVTGNADFAEMFETISGRSIPPGYFVTSESDKIRAARSSDDFILGVTSAAPAFLGDAEDLRWKDKYVKDEWGRIKYRRVVIHEQKDENGSITTPERTEMRPVINPAWNGSEEYVPRSQRPEWVPVAAMGKVFVRDDGTCRVDGYCMPDNNGIATASKNGYRVLKRTGPRQVLIWLK